MDPRDEIREQIAEQIAELESHRLRLELLSQKALTRGGPDAERIEAQARAKLREISNKINNLRASLE